MTTKWDLIDDEEKAWMEKIPFRSRCPACDTWLETEADFAKHFIVRDKRYKNLGDCPHSGRDWTRGI